MPTIPRVLVVDADAVRGTALAELIAPAGYESRYALPADPAVAAPTDILLLSSDRVDAALVARLASVNTECELVLVASEAAAPAARAALRRFRLDVVVRDHAADDVLFALERAVRDRNARCELAMLRARVRADAQRALVGSSPAVALVRELVGRAAASHRTVLLWGEAGTGKSTVARLMHDLSERAARPFVTLRCDEREAGALEQALFGPGPGGVFEAARGGTLLLDEARSLSRGLYARLGAALVGRATADAPSLDVRLVLTIRTAERESAADACDLFGDPNVLAIALPPLRERRRDIPQLVQHFRGQAARGRDDTPSMAAESLAHLLAHHWPGNVRELQHWVDRMSLAEDGARGAGQRGSIVPRSAEFHSIDEARLTLAALERRYILHVLAQEGGHQSRAAERLGIDRRTLYRKLKEYRDGDASLRIAG